MRPRPSRAGPIRGKRASMALFFRIREGGATALPQHENAARRRLGLRDKLRRIGRPRSRGGAGFAPEEGAEVEAWIASGRARLAAIGAEALPLAAEATNPAAKALLPSRHDLRAQLLRRRSGEDDE